MPLPAPVTIAVLSARSHAGEGCFALLCCVFVAFITPSVYYPPAPGPACTRPLARVTLGRRAAQAAGAGGSALGVADLGDYATVVLADIPGLIEGAHLGAGLGFAFLRHIQRTRVLIHLLDGLAANPVADFDQILTELSLFDEHLREKPMIVALNKMDLPDVSAIWDGVKAEIKKRGGKVTREAGPMKHGSTVIAFVEDPDGYKIELIQRGTQGAK